MAGLLDAISYATSTPTERAQILENQTRAAGVQQARLESAARAKMLGIVDPYTGIDYGKQAPAPLMGAPQPQAGGLMGSPPPAQAPAMSDQQRLYNQAFPEQAATMARIAPMMQALPPGEQALYLLAPDKWAEARAKNIIEPDDAKLVDTLTSRIKAVGGPTSPDAAPYMSLLTAKTQNLEPAKLAEEIRSHKATEQTAAAQAAAGAVDVQPDPNNPGHFILINKLTGGTQGVGVGGIQLPPPGPVPMPTTGLPAGGQPPQPQGGAGAAPTGSPAPPAASPATDFTPQLSPEIEQRIRMLPPANQGMVRAILSGRMAPPTGRILADPVMGPLFRQALQVDPQFDEATWTARNKMVTGMADTKNQTMGLRIDSAKKLINHTTDLLATAADRGQNLGAALEMPGNKLTDWFSTGQGKSNLNKFNQAKEGVSSEYVNMMTGGQGSESGRSAIKENLSENDPLSGTIGSVGTIIDQMEGQINPLIDQYNGVMKTNIGTGQVLGNDTMQKLTAIKALAAAQRAGQPISPEVVKETLAGRGLLSPGAAKQMAKVPGQMPVFVRDPQSGKIVRQQ